MGMNDNLIEDYRNIITNVLLDDELIVAVLGNDKISVEESDVLLRGDKPHITPYEFLPATLTETGSYIMYDLEERAEYSRNSTNTFYSEITLYMWVVTHRDMPKYEGNTIPEIKSRLRNDVLSRRLKQLFADKEGLGISKNHFISNLIFNPYNNNYMGRVLTFTITDWSDKLRYRYGRANKPVGAQDVQD